MAFIRVLLEKVSLCSPGCLRAHIEAQAGLKSSPVLLHQTPGCLNYKHGTHDFKLIKHKVKAYEDIN